MYCPHCGRPAEPGAVYCVRCGASLPQLAAAKPQAAPTMTGGPARQRSPLITVVAAIAAALVVLLCCCLALGGGVGLCVLLSPTPTPTPTATSTPTPTVPVMPTVTPRPTWTPTRTLRPTPSETSAPGAVKVYTSAQYGFSIMYPGDWTVKETTTGPSFTSSRTGSSAGIMLLPGIGARGDARYLTDTYMTSLERLFDEVQVETEATRTFNGRPWRYLHIAGSYGNVEFKIDLYASIHTNDDGYILAGFASPQNYDQDTVVFTAMMGTWRFLR